MKWIRHRDDKTFHLFDAYLEKSACGEKEKPHIMDAIRFIDGKSDPDLMCRECTANIREFIKKRS